MLQASPQTSPTLQADLMALDALFRHIAERGRKIRSQNQTADSDNLGRETLSAGQDPKPQGKESI